MSEAAVLADSRKAGKHGRILLKEGKFAEAEHLLAQACIEFPDIAPVHFLRTQALLMLGMVDEAVPAIARAMELEPENPRHVLANIVALAASGKFAKARDAITSSPEQAPDVPVRLRSLILHHWKAGRFEPALAFAQAAVALFPNVDEFRIFCAKTLIAAGRYAHALSAIEPVDAAEWRTERDRLRARAHLLLGDTDSARVAYEAIFFAAPDDVDAIRNLRNLSQMLGRAEEETLYDSRLSVALSKQLPPDLTQGLTALDTSAPRTIAMGEKARWAWEVADQEKWTLDEWRARVAWGQAAHSLLKQWRRASGERNYEIDALIDGPSRATLDALAGPHACLCVTTHMGPMAAAVQYLQNSGRVFHGFGWGGTANFEGGKAPLRLAADGPVSPLRELMSEIEAGHLIGFAGDFHDPGRPKRIDFLSRTVTLSTFVPRLAFKHRIPTLWWQALWRDGRITIELARLPDPRDLPFEDWCGRWFAAYLAHVEAVMRSAPENLNLGAGIWKNVDDRPTTSAKAILTSMFRANHRTTS